MNHISIHQIRKFLNGIMNAGMILSLCFGASSSPAVHAQEAGTVTPTEKVMKSPTGISDQNYIPGQLIVKFQPTIAVSKDLATTSSSEVNDLLAQVGVTSIEPMIKWPNGGKPADFPEIDSYHVLNFSPKSDIYTAQQILTSSENIEFSFPNYIIKIADNGNKFSTQKKSTSNGISPALTQDPNDTYYQNYQWTLHDDHLKFRSAWNMTTGSPDIVVAVLDTGLDINHPDIGGKNTGTGYNFVWNTYDITDDNGHGTAVSGLIAAYSNNNAGITGICWDCKIMPVKVCNDKGDICNIIDVINGMLWAANHGAHIINMSLSGNILDSGYQNPATAIQQFFDYVYNKGVVIVAAAGNNNENLVIPTDSNPESIIFPAAFDHVIAVGAVNKLDQRCNFIKSVCGWDQVYMTASGWGERLDVVAPGSMDYPSTYISGSGNDSTKDYVMNMGGTSGAAPHVAGLAALILSINPHQNPDDVETLIEQNAVDLGVQGKDVDFGWGRINAEAAVKSVSADNAIFVSHVTYPENSPMNPSQSFTKIWRMKNTGNTTWGSGYSLAFVSGYQMGAPTSVPVLSTLPNNTTDIPVNMTAPSSPSTYTGYWQMRNPSGQTFGQQILVQIIVKSVTACPAVSGEVRLYVQTNCGGNIAILGHTGNWDLSSNFNDATQSIAIPNGWSARLFENADLAGPNVCIPVTTNDLHIYNYSNGDTAWKSATYITVYNQSNCPDTVTDDATFVDQSPSYPTVSTGQSFQIYFIVKNTGTSTWQPGSYWLQNRENGALVADAQQSLSRSVGPNETYTWTINVTAPTSPGTYLSAWTVNHEGTNFGPYMWVEVTVTAPSEPPLLSLTLGSNVTNHLITIELRSTTGFGQLLGSVFTGLATTDANGNITSFPLNNVSPGTYNILVKPQTWLRKQVNSIILASGLNPPIDFQPLHPYCDIIENNRVDIFDYNQLVADFGTTNTRSDCDKDGTVGIFDYNVLVSYFGYIGDGGEIITGGPAATHATNTALGKLSLDLAQTATHLTKISQTTEVGQVVTLNLDYDTASLPMAGVDAFIDYDQCVLEPLTDQITHSGVFTHNDVEVISTPGTLEYLGHTWSGVDPGAPVSGVGNLISIPFRVIAGLPSSTNVAIRFKPGSTFLSNMDEDGTIQPFLGSVENAVLYPTGTPQRVTQSAKMISPLTGTTINQNFVLLEAQASDPCNGLHQVTFYVFYDGKWHAVGSDKDGTDGWQVYWDARQVADQIIKVKALAGDFAGNGVETTVSDNIMLDREPPTVTEITFDPTSATIGQIVSVSVNLTDNLTGPKHTEIYIDPSIDSSTTSAWNPIGSFNGASGNIQWDTTGYLSGSHKVFVLVEDNAGNRTVWPTEGVTPLVYQLFNPLTISGNAGISWVTLSYMDGTFKHVIPTNNGDYWFRVPYNWSGVVTPFLTGYTFSPESQTYSNIQADQTDQNFTASLIPYLISVSKSGTGSGTITSYPARINCGSTCSTSINYNTIVTLTATPDTDSAFTGWSGSGCTGMGACTITMNEAKSITANFSMYTSRIYLPLVHSNH